MPKMTKTRERPGDGNPIVIEIEMRGKIVEMEIICPICQSSKFWLSQDHNLLYCGGCRSTNGRRYGDFAMPDGIKWELGK